MTKVKKGIAFTAFGMFAALLAFLLFSEFNRSYSLRPQEKLLISIFTALCLFMGAGFLRSAEESVEKKNKIVKTTTWIAFGLYALLACSMLFWDSMLRRTNWSQYMQNLPYLKNSINLIPFKEISFYAVNVFTSQSVPSGYALQSILGNLVAFAPMGFFLPVLFKRQRKLWVFTLTILGLLVLVETAQLFLMVGSCDIDDIILNAAGALLVYGVLKLRFFSNRLIKLGFTSISPHKPLQPGTLA